ncbi:MAG: hypothetical protein V4467_03070 [Patescibacteria group bacterium]
MDIKKLFALADRAKTIEAGQNYALPNAVFCVLLDVLFKGKEGAQSLRVELETEDSDGLYVNEAYYDLFVLRHSDGEGLCIPAPLLHVETAMTLTKRALVTVRGQHDRQHEPAESEEFFRLWEQFHEEVSPARLLDSVREHLSKSARLAAGFLETE